MADPHQYAEKVYTSIPQQSTFEISDISIPDDASVGTRIAFVITAACKECPAVWENNERFPERYKSEVRRKVFFTVIGQVSYWTDYVLS